jgi:hypothetical protein
MCLACDALCELLGQLSMGVKRHDACARDQYLSLCRVPGDAAYRYCQVSMNEVWLDFTVVSDQYRATLGCCRVLVLESECN